MNISAASVVLVVTLVHLPSPSFAPFPETHPLNFANPWIEPWWQRLDKNEQKVGKQ